ncbi:uncharacterized protein G2W53_018401 [Senna tora]|uniref:Uncharacterized protein n=1 Tax=Senna tora TaxID=362788 RepID=A0A834TSH2_9FABA|nr:uncharacterized protein G2W53_018401 [Senna tora]
MGISKRHVNQGIGVKVIESTHLKATLLPSPSRGCLIHSPNTGLNSMAPIT